MCRQRLARVLLFGCLLTVLGGGAPLVRPPAAQAVGQPFHAQAVQAAPALDWTALPVPLRPHAGDDGDKDDGDKHDGDKCSVVELKCDEVQQEQECVVPSKVVRVVPVPVVKVVTVEKKIFVPVEKKVFVTVEKKVFVPVEKVVKVFVPVEKKVFVPVEKVVKVFVPVPVPATPEVKVVPVPATPVVKVVVPVPPPVTPTPMPMPPGDPMF
jgi:hypothetical protein